MSYIEANQKAQKRLRAAEYMLTVTLPVVQDSKLLLAILENLYEAVISSVSSILYRDRMLKLIPPFREDVDSKINTFHLYCAEKHSFDKDAIEVMNKIKKIIDVHRFSPIEFTRKDKYIICSGSYNIITLSKTEIIKDIEKVQRFINQVEVKINE